MSSMEGLRRGYTEMAERSIGAAKMCEEIIRCFERELDGKERAECVQRAESAGPFTRLLKTESPATWTPPDRWTFSALHEAAKQGDPVAVKGWLTLGAEANAEDPVLGLRAMHYTAISGKTEVVDILLKAGADVNAAENRKKHLKPRRQQPLHFALFREDVVMVAKLLGAGADVNAMYDDDGFTALHWAAQKGDTRLISIVLAAGADRRRCASRGGGGRRPGRACRPASAPRRCLAPGGREDGARRSARPHRRLQCRS